MRKKYVIPIGSVIALQYPIKKRKKKLNQFINVATFFPILLKFSYLRTVIFTQNCTRID